MNLELNGMVEMNENEMVTINGGGLGLLVAVVVFLAVSKPVY